jgi:hypothetical protein
VVLEADGITKGGRGTRSASGVVAWRFVFQNPTGGNGIFSATLSYGPAPKGFGRVRGYRTPFLDDVVIRRAPRMTLAAAVRRLRRAGHTGRFYNVTLRNPLGPRVTNPLYIFAFARRFVGVDTVTGRVRAL